MQVVDFEGCFVIEGRETEVCQLRVILSTGGDGVTSGSGTMALPLALVGTAPGTALTFRTSAGDEIALDLREVDAAEGVGYFLTTGAVPAQQRAERTA